MMKLIKYTLTIIVVLMCELLSLSAYVLSDIIQYGIALPPIDGSNQYVYYPLYTANILDVFGGIILAIPLFLISFFLSGIKSSFSGCFGFFSNGFKFIIMYVTVQVFIFHPGINGFLLVMYAFGQIYNHPAPLKPPPEIEAQILSTPNGMTAAIHTGIGQIIMPMIAFVGMLVFYKILKSIKNTPYSPSYDDYDKYDPAAEAFERKWQKKLKEQENQK